jgi:hypothetical protein
MLKVNGRQTPSDGKRLNTTQSGLSEIEKNNQKSNWLGE